jgi:DNA polymerase-1
MDKLFLLDAYAIIYRSYYAFINAPRINSKGMNTSTIMGFCNTLNEVLTKEKPTHIAVAFDHGKTFRHDVFPAYKAQRQETPEDIKLSIPIIKDILNAYNIPILQVDGFEADDVIGTIAHKADLEGMKTYMVTPDKDYAQLVTDNVFMYRPRHGGGYDTMGPKEVCEKYGIDNTAQVIDLLGLMGDSADNFPGCPGVGEKTAVKLIMQFGNIETLLSSTDQIKGKMREKVEDAKEDIKMSKFLATIRQDVPVTITFDEMKVSEPDEIRLREIFTDLEFKSLADRVLKKTAPKPKNANLQLDLFGESTAVGEGMFVNSSLDTFKTSGAKYHLIETEEDARKLSELIVTNKEVAFDTETTSINAIDAELVGLSFALKEKEAYYVAIPANREEALRIVNIFKNVYENENIVKIGQNTKYDIEVLKNYGIEVKAPLWDTMIAHYLINPGRENNMDYMAETLLKYQTIHIEELIGPKGPRQKNMRDLSPTEIRDYAAEDADITLRLKNVLKPKLEEVGAEDLFYNIEMPLVPILADMEYTGVKLDTKALDEVRLTFNERMIQLEKEIYELAGQEFNISSPRQVGDILFGKLQIIEKAKKTKTGQYQTSEEVLQQLSSKHPIVEKILIYRGLKKLIGTYVDALPKLINPRTGHIHTSFNQCVTTTGRLSSSDPNLQNIPVRGEDGKEIRKTIIPEEEQEFFSADYSQIELRVMASMSGDENMIEAFTSDADIHAATSAKIFHKPIEEVTKDERAKAKRANFGIIYGISVFGLAQNMGIDRAEAKALIDGYFETFPGVQKFMEESKKRVSEKGYAETLYHRRRYLPDINSHNGTVRAVAERNAINAPIQGTAADIIKIAMIRIYKRFKEENIKSKMILQVHDELNFSVLPEEKFHVKQIVLEEMQNAATLRVPLIADCGWGSNWLEAH